jgi:adenine-specific DNA-methyltransferase
LRAAKDLGHRRRLLQVLQPFRKKISESDCQIRGKFRRDIRPSFDPASLIWDRPVVVNYDLPWNPQRIEQRIGRCHRYGQKHDVVVVNFLNRKNEADQRVYQLLSEKFKLFEGVFGASDEVLGAVESGVDFEKRIASIYQQCRQTDDIISAFDQLQLELSLEINEAMSQTRQKLLENFDDEVREKLKVRKEDALEQLGRFERHLMRVTRHL